MQIGTTESNVSTKVTSYMGGSGGRVYGTYYQILVDFTKLDGLSLDTAGWREHLQEGSGI